VALSPLPGAPEAADALAVPEAFGFDVSAGFSVFFLAGMGEFCPLARRARPCSDAARSGPTLERARPALKRMRSFTLSDFDFALPPELIAQQPAAERSASRLL